MAVRLGEPVARGALADARGAARALIAVASSPVMPRWEAYRAEVERCAVPELPLEPAAALTEALGGRALIPLGGATRIVAALVSFTDDHHEPVPPELFPRAASLAFIERLRTSAAPWGRAAQLAAAVELTRDGFAALLVCHAATRQLARGRDLRALGPAAVTTVEVRCAIGRTIAAFPAELSRGGDPLGDTYHYWANVIAGVTAVTLGGLRGAAIDRMFAAGPFLMSAVREGAFRRRLFYGNHRHVDAVGLAHGRALARGP